MKNQAKLLVIEGTDGSGKATQTRMLKDRLKKEGFSIETMSFPRYKDTIFGALLRECLDGKRGDFVDIDPRIASVLYAADRHASLEELNLLMEKNDFVILDRYVSANQLHQGGKILDVEKRQEFMEWLRRMEHDSFKLPKPDVIFFLDVPVEVTIGLIVARAEEESVEVDAHESDKDHLIAARESGLYLAKHEDSWIRVNCAENGELMTREDIHEKIFKSISSLFGDV